MKKTKRSMSRLLALVLAVMTALTMALPVLAVERGTGDNLTITVRNNEGLLTMKDDQFKAYQLFAGTPNQDVDRPVADADQQMWNASQWNNWSLANIQWGKDVKGSDLLTALQKLNADTDKAEWPEFFEAGSGNNIFAAIADPTAKDAAGKLAELLVGKSNAFLQAFSKFVVEGNDTGYLKPDAKGVGSKANNSGTEDNATDDTSVITVEDPGYYLVVEESNTADGDRKVAVSEYILAVVGHQEINLKASVPTVDKEIVDGNGTDKNGDPTTKGDAAGISDIVEFKLTGHISKNFPDFDYYEYYFRDTLSKGLSFYDSDPDSVTVKVTIKTKDGDVTYEIAKEDGNKDTGDDGTGYTVVVEKITSEDVTNGKEIWGKKVTSADVGKTYLSVEFSDLKNLMGKVVPVTPEASAVKIPWENVVAPYDTNVTISVEYSAQVNGDAVIGSEGNPNDVYLEYSNDPNHDGTGETEEKTVYIYSFGLDLTKIGSDAAHDDKDTDGPDGPDGRGLEGAGFVLKNKAGQYAKFEDAVDEAGKSIRRLVGWEEATVVEGLIKAYTDAKEAYEKASNATETDAKATLDAAKEALKPYLLTSGAEGKIPDVTGLDEGEYTLQEIVTPDGYNTMDPFWFMIKPVYEETGKLKSVIYTPSEGEFVTYDVDTDKEATAAGQRAVFSTGLLPETLVNQKAPLLPFTGGIGTAIFYILGGVLIAGAALYLVLSSRKRSR